MNVLERQLNKLESTQAFVRLSPAKLVVKIALRPVARLER